MNDCKHTFSWDKSKSSRLITFLYKIYPGVKIGFVNSNKCTKCGKEFPYEMISELESEKPLSKGVAD